LQASARHCLPDSSAAAKAIDWSLNRWPALIRDRNDVALRIDSGSVENRIRPIALGRSNRLFGGLLRAGPRSARVADRPRDQA